MLEKRHSKRFPVVLKLEISSLFKQDNVKVDNVHAPIDVYDISRDGIGFESESVLPLGYYFNSKIQLGDADSCLYSVVKIVRQEVLKDKLFLYGAEFIGMPSIMLYVFEEFEDKFKKVED